MIRLKNPYYQEVNQRLIDLETVANALDAKLQLFPNLEFVTGEQILQHVPEANNFKPYTDGEIDYIAQKIGSEVVES